MISRKLYSLKITRDIFEKHPRIPHTQLHRIIKEKTGIKMRDTTERYIKEGYDKAIIRPPRPILRYHSNKHQHISFVEGNLLDFENLIEDVKNIRYACALTGNSEKIMVTSFSYPGRDLFFLGYTRADGFDSSEHHCLKRLEFSSDEEPILIDVPSPTLHWDSKDWDLFHVLSPNMRLPYSVLSKNKTINLGWRAIKNRMEKNIFPVCDVAAYFFPKGQNNYQQLFLQFKTEYQKNLLERLNYLQTTSYFLLFGRGEVGIFVFPENMNNVLKIFKKIEIEGIIDDFQYFLPLEWSHCDLGRPWASSASSS